MHEELPSFVECPSGRRIACRFRAGSGPTLVFLPGYSSDMEGAKALALDDWGGSRGIPVLRFDYSGTGSSPGAFSDGTLDRWIEDSLAVLDQVAGEPAVLIGSSMGGWIALHVAMRRPKKILALVGVAAAPDFTDWGFSAEQKSELQSRGSLSRASTHGAEPQLTTARFWDSGQRLRLLEAPIDVTCPVRLIHGDQDEDVPLSVPFRLMDRLRSADVQLTVIKGGGHRLSEPHEIDAILRAVEALVEQTS